MRPCAPVSSRAKLRDWSPRRDKCQFSTTSPPLLSFRGLLKDSEVSSEKTVKKEANFKALEALQEVPPIATA
jgi:hypothetical protein